MDDLKYWLAFSRISGLGPKKFEALLQAFDSMEDAWIAGKRDLTAAGLDARTAGRIAEERVEVYPDSELERLESAGVTAIPRTSPEYPAALKEIYDPPAVIFIRGKFAEADKRSIAVVGTRCLTPYGREACRRLSKDLARNGVTVISGLARGIDGVAHEATLDAGGRTIAVLGSGLDRIYPGEHVQLARRIADNGVVISEFPLGSRANARNFPRRNRILSALTLGTLVVEAPMKSGAMLTVEHAVQQNRDVFAVPGTIFSDPSKGTNWLIQQGAKLVSSAKDVLDELNIVVLEDQLPLVEPQVDDETERRILATLGEEPLHIDDVTRTTGLTSPVVASTLSLTELKGLVRQAGSMQYVQARMSHTPDLTRSGEFQRK